MSAPPEVEPAAATSGARRILLVVLAFLAFLLVPGAPDSPFSGMPLFGQTLIGLTATLVAAAGLALFPAPNRVSSWWIVGLVGMAMLKLALSYGAASTGWRGAYTVLDEPGRSPELFLTGLSRSHFRIDPRIEFDGPTFALAFFNDYERYGQHWAYGRREVEFPWRVQWTGYVWVTDAVPVPLPLTVRALGELEIDLDGGRIFSVDGAGDPLPVTTRPLTLGPHEIAVTYTKPAKTVPLAVVLPPVDVRVTPRLVSPRALRRSVLLARATTAMGWAAGMLFVFSIARAYRPLTTTLRAVATTGFPRLAVWVAFASLVVIAYNTSSRFRGVTTYLQSGDDPLVYESNARDIALHGWLMPGGQLPGHGRAFFFYPFYSYVLAGAHALLGEDLSSAVFFNGVSVAFIVLLQWWLGWSRLRGWAVVVVAVALEEFCRRHAFLYILSTFTDSFFIAMVFLALCASYRALVSWSTRAWLLAGIAAAFAAATRPSFMTYPGIFAAVLLLGWRTASLTSRLRAAATLMAGTLLGFAPFALRNKIMSGEWILLVRSWIQIPYFLVAPEDLDRPHAVNGLADALATAWHIAAAHPLRVLVVELRKLGFTLGMLPLGPPGEQSHPEFMVLTVLFIAALLLRRIPRTLAFVLGSFALSHIVAMVLAAPWTYGYKTILPLHAAFLLGAAFLLPKRADRLLVD